jgi:hypothetical protein
MGPAIDLDQSAGGSPRLLSNNHVRDLGQGNMPFHAAFTPVRNIAIEPESAPAPE